MKQQIHQLAAAAAAAASAYPAALAQLAAASGGAFSPDFAAASALAAVSLVWPEQYNLAARFAGVAETAHHGVSSGSACHSAVSNIRLDLRQHMQWTTSHSEMRALKADPSTYLTPGCIQQVHAS